MISFTFSAIGTEWQIDIYDSLSQIQSLEIEEKILERIELFDSTYSRFRKESWVVSQSRRTGTVNAPPDLMPLLTLYEKLYSISNGVFTPLIGQLLVQAGYDELYTLKAQTLTSPPPLPETITHTDNTISFKRRVLLDFGAAGKGYLVDIISRILDQEHIVTYCIDASGDIFYKARSDESIRVGLEHPDDPTLAIGVAHILNQSICGSAGNRRTWGNFHHTINPKTLKSPSEIKATWVIADTALLADALSTCLFLDPHPEKYKDFKFNYVLMYKDNTAQKSLAFPGELFT